MNNDTGYSDKDCNYVLEIFENKHKKLIMKDLMEYYRVSFNPQIELREDLLSQLGFVPCQACLKI